MIPEDVLRIIESMSEFVLRYAIALAAAGTLTMALLEASKRLFKSREKYNERVLRNWIADTACRYASKKIKLAVKEEPAFRDRVYRQLLHLTTGEDRNDPAIALRQDMMGKVMAHVPWFRLRTWNALFTLDLERMMGQIQNAADVALANPEIYPELYLFLTTGADKDDVESWPELSQTMQAKPQVAKDRASVYSRLQQVVRRRLDAFQLTTAYRWEHRYQRRSVVLGAVLLFASLVHLRWGMENILQDGMAMMWKSSEDARSFVRILLASLIGGIAAPTARDMVVALKKVRGG